MMWCACTSCGSSNLVRSSCPLEWRPMRYGTGASRKWRREAGRMGTYTCCHWKGNIKAVMLSATVISLW